MSIDVSFGICVGEKVLPTSLVLDANSYIVLVSVPTLYKPYRPLLINLTINFDITST